MTSAIKGMDRWLGLLKEQAQTAPARGRDAAVAEAERVKVRAQALCPVDKGDLVNSARVVPTETGAAVAFTDPKAVIVHERLDVHHRVGQAKFLERAMHEAEQGFGDRIGEAFAQAGDGGGR